LDRGSSASFSCLTLSECTKLMGFWQKHPGKPGITWPESVDGALCFGWIESGTQVSENAQLLGDDRQAGKKRSPAAHPLDQL
jgi:hypothetical protein